MHMLALMADFWECKHIPFVCGALPSKVEAKLASGSSNTHESAAPRRNLAADRCQTCLPARTKNKTENGCFSGRRRNKNGNINKNQGQESAAKNNDGGDDKDGAIVVHKITSATYMNGWHAQHRTMMFRSSRAITSRALGS
eukprot:122477-Pelagomonas_calceolata.AAC.7